MSWMTYFIYLVQLQMLIQKFLPYHKTWKALSPSLLITKQGRTINLRKASLPQSHIWSDIYCRISYLCIRVAVAAAAAVRSAGPAGAAAASPQSICRSYRCSGIIINWVGKEEKEEWNGEEGVVHMFPRTLLFSKSRHCTPKGFLRLDERVQWLSGMVTTRTVCLISETFIRYSQ